VLGLVVAAALLAGCGSSASDNGIATKTPQEIVAEAKAAADGAASVHMLFSGVSNGRPLSLDMELLAGTGGHGRITENGVGLEVILLGGDIYINGSPAFWRANGGEAAAQLFQGKWLKAAARSGSFASITSLTDLRKLIDKALTDHAALSAAGTTTINGQRAVAVRDVNGGVIYVAVMGKPFPIELTKRAGGAATIVFDRWNQAVTVASPPNAININQLRTGHP